MLRMKQMLRIKKRRVFDVGHKSRTSNTPIAIRRIRSIRRIRVQQLNLDVCLEKCSSLAALGTTGNYQIFTRSSGLRHILSPGFTSKARMKASLLVSGTNARAMPGECGLVSSWLRRAASRNFVRQICA